MADLAEFRREYEANTLAEAVYNREHYPEIAANPNWRREVDRFYVVNPFSINGTRVVRPDYPPEFQYPGYIELNARVEQLKRQRQNKKERNAAEVASRIGMDALLPIGMRIGTSLEDPHGQIKDLLADKPIKLKLRQPAETELVEILANTPYDDYFSNRHRIRQLIQERAQRADASDTQRAGKRRRKSVSRRKYKRV